MGPFAASSSLAAVAPPDVAAGGDLDASTRLVRFVWLDNNGIPRAKAVTRALWGQRSREGVGMAVCRQAANILDHVQPVAGFGAVGEVRMVPDLSTLFPLAHAPGAAAVLCDGIDSAGQPWAACPRAFLRRMITAAARDDLTIIAAFEPEFSLCTGLPRPFQPIDDSLCFDVGALDQTHDLAFALLRALEDAGLQPEMFHSEYSPGQYELTVAARPALRAADELAIYRMLVRGVAPRFGHWATFAPAPSETVRGNGCHLHLSLWRDGRNLLVGAGQERLSEIGQWFSNGLLLHAPALMAVTCPSVNSYQRLRPGRFAGASLRQGIDDREALVRIAGTAAGTSLDGINLEFRACDGTINPFIALGCIIAAGLDGIKRQSSADDVDVARDLPESLAVALTALENDLVLSNALGKELFDAYLAVKHSDVEELVGLDSAGLAALYTSRF